MEFRLLLLAFAMCIFIAACAYDNAEDLYGKVSCPPEGVSFASDILPITSSNCAIPGCHISGQQLPTLQTYEQISANAPKVRDLTSGGIMPPSTSGKTITPEEIDLISCWVESGAPDN
ncbi:MAG: hypothetical protein U5K79_01540 [Cyclobacteriaceae bacterium]|nr:hypothetical protein [Cyclobacteriaceae bacterium]